jgi:hypothetical protein
MTHNPYAPPTVQVDGVEEITAFDFSNTADYSFTPKQLWWAGIFCVLGVILTPIYFALVYFAQSIPSLKFPWIATAYINTALSIYVYLILKKLLNEKSGYRAANLAISLFILASIVSALTAPLNNAAETSMFYTWLSIAELVVFGGLAIYLGIKLLRCEDVLFGQIKTIAYLTIAMGITMASVVLVLFSFLISVALSIAMAILFFRASQALAKVQS